MVRHWDATSINFEKCNYNKKKGGGALHVFMAQEIDKDRDIY